MWLLLIFGVIMVVLFIIDIYFDKKNKEERRKKKEVFKMNDLKSIVVEQIKLIKHEEVRKAEAKKQAEAEEQRKAIKEESLWKEAEKTFNYRKKIIEGSKIREVLEFIVQCLNSSDEDFSLLKKSVLKMINENQQYSFDENTRFYVRNSSFSGNKDYYIYIKINDCTERLISISYSDDLIFINRCLFHYLKSAKLENDKEKMVQQVVNFLITD